MKALEIFLLFCRGFALVFRASPLFASSLFLLNVLVSLAPAASLWLMKLIVDQLTSLFDVSANVSSEGNLLCNLAFSYSIGRGISIDCSLLALISLIMVQLSLWLLSQCLSALQDALSSNARNNFEYYISTRIMEKCGAMDMAYFENADNLDRLDKVIRGASMSAWNLIWMSFGLVGSCVTMLSFLVIIARLHWAAPLLVVAATSPQMIASAHFARKRWQLFTSSSADMRLRNYVRQLLTSADAATEIKLFALSDYLIKQFEHYAGKFYKLENELARKTAASDFLLGTLSTVLIAILWAYIAFQAWLRAITTGDALLYFQSSSSCRSNLLGLFTQGGRLYEHMLFLSDLFEFLDTEPADLKGALTPSLLDRTSVQVERASSNAGDIHINQGIEFRDVSFKYPDREEIILRNLSFKAPATGSIAIVGKNGAGKSTLVKLLIRLYDPTEGMILIDGKDARSLEIDYYRKHFSVVFQNFHRYYLSLRENIGFGEVDYMNDIERIENSAARVGADLIAARLSRGYETHLSRQYNKNGEELSLGQWQKIALARGLIRQSPVVILDEPTASLDAFGEYEMYKLFEELTKERLSILISHRFSTVRMADTILVLDEGRIVEQGSHDILMEAKGLYASMYDAQADRYR